MPHSKSNPFMSKYNIYEKKAREATYRTLISPEVMDRLQKQIVQKIVVEKKYRDRNYSAKVLATDLDTNTRYISAVVNVRFHKNYSEYINSYRIEEARALLTDKRYILNTMEDISDMVGFSNRQSFYAAFYRFYGITPRQYRMTQLREHPALAEALRQAKKELAEQKKKIEP